MPEARLAKRSVPAHENTVREYTDDIALRIGGARARRSAQELLSLMWDKNPGWVSAHADDSVPLEVRAAVGNAVEAVARGTPLAYAAGRAAFRNLVLSVDERVLIPRPETEIVVEEALRVCSAGVAVDVGTGSGAIALALATEGGFERVIATDVSADALAVARANVEAIAPGCPVELRCGSLLGPLRGHCVDLIVSNPPYVAAAEMLELPGGVRDWEPSVALLSGADGLDHTSRLVAAAERFLCPGGWLVLEVDSRRAAAVSGIIASRRGFTDIQIRPDLTGRPRVALAQWSADTENLI